MYCTRCGKELSDDMQFCVNCGKRVEEMVAEVPQDKNAAAGNTILDTNQVEAKSENETLKNLWDIVKTIVSIVIVIVVVIAAIRYFSDPYRNVLNIDSKRKAYQTSQEVIRDQIYTPKSAEFPKFDTKYISHGSELVEYEGQEYWGYTVTAYVDYENIFGVEVRSDYQVLIGLPKGGDSDGYYYEVIYFD